MKRLMGLLMLVCLLAFPACAAPYANQNPKVCLPEEIDLSGVTLKNGWLKGVIGLPESVGNVRLLIDCPLPENFTDSQQQRLTVSYPKLTKDMLREALASIGQSADGGELRHTVSDPLTRMVKFELEKELSHAAVLPRRIGDHPKRAEMEAAKQVLRELAAALDVQLSDDFLSAQRNTYADLCLIHPGESSSAAQLIARGERSFLAQEKRYGNRDGADDMTLLRAMYEIDGLPVMNQYYWMQSGEAFGSSSELLAAVSDDGRLVMAEVWGTPKVEKRQPVSIPAREWQEFLREWVASVYWPDSQLDDTAQHSEISGEGIRYGTYEVITRIAPCWVGREKYTLEPGWYGVIEKRLLNGEELLQKTLGTASAADLARVF